MKNVASLILAAGFCTVFFSVPSAKAAENGISSGPGAVPVSEAFGQLGRVAGDRSGVYPNITAAVIKTNTVSDASKSGFNFPCWWKDCYSLPKTKESLAKLAQTGARWVVLTPTWRMSAPEDSHIFMDDTTATDDSLRTVIRNAKALGLSVALKPHVDLKDVSRFYINPRDPQVWFAEYQAMLLQYARLAAEERVDMIVVGTELIHLDGAAYSAYWGGMISQVRKVYSGPLTYAADWYKFPLVSFWDKLDFIGIDCYFPQVSGYYLAMQLGWQSYKPTVKAVSALYGKPVIFTEIGITSQKGANLKPWEWKEFGPVDLKIQADYFESMLSVFGDSPWFAGFWQWGWEIEPDAGGPNDKTMTVQGKPALDILKTYFAR